MAPNYPDVRSDFNEINIVYLRCIGGELCSPTALAQKLAPVGLDARKIAAEIARLTADEWKGLKVYNIELNIIFVISSRRRCNDLEIKYNVV